MSSMIGFWLICLAGEIIIVAIAGYDLELKDKVLLVVLFQVFIGLMIIGLSMMGIE